MASQSTLSAVAQTPKQFFDESGLRPNGHPLLAQGETPRRQMSDDGILFETFSGLLSPPIGDQHSQIFIRGNRLRVTLVRVFVRRHVAQADQYLVLRCSQG